jgi:hypothetical protein
MHCLPRDFNNHSLTQQLYVFVEPKVHYCVQSIPPIDMAQSQISSVPSFIIHFLIYYNIITCTSNSSICDFF